MKQKYDSLVRKYEELQTKNLQVETDNEETLRNERRLLYFQGKIDELEKNLELRIQ